MPYAFLIFAGIAELLLLLAHWFIYKTIVIFFGISSVSAIWALRVVFFALAISFFLASYLGYKYFNKAVRIFYTISAMWMNILYFVGLASVLCWLILGFSNLTDMRLIAIYAFGSAGILSVYTLINGYSLRTTYVKVRLKNLPDHWKSKKIAWVSDTHFGHVRNYVFSRFVAWRVQRLNPELLLLGGDMYDGLAIDSHRALEPFSKLKIPHGIFFVTGNHEQFTDPTKYYKAIEENNIRILKNEKLEIEGLQLVGVDYIDSRGAENYKKILEQMSIDRSKPSIVMKHVPDHLEQAANAGVSLHISGHTHNGQMWPFGLIAKRIFKGFNYGLKPLGEMFVYVSSGAGTWGPPGRFLTKAEIVIFNLE